MEFVIDSCWVKPTIQMLEKIKIGGNTGGKQKLRDIEKLNKPKKLKHYCTENNTDIFNVERKYFWEIIKEIYANGIHGFVLDEQTPEIIEHKLSVLDRHRILTRDEALPVLTEVFPNVDKSILSEMVEIVVESGKKNWSLLMQKKIDEIENDEFKKLIEIC